MPEYQINNGILRNVRRYISNGIRKKKNFEQIQQGLQNIYPDKNFEWFLDVWKDHHKNGKIIMTDAYLMREKNIYSRAEKDDNWRNR
jgi:hypothetical protein